MTRDPIDPTPERTAGPGPADRLGPRFRLADESERAALESVWRGLELPPPAPPPPGFARRIAARAADEGRSGAGALLGAAPRWAAVLVFAAGIALGTLVSSGLAADDSGDGVEAEESLADSTLAAHYLDSVDADSGAIEATSSAGRSVAP